MFPARVDEVIHGLSSGLATYRLSTNVSQDGDTCGSAEWEQTHGKKKVKVCLDIDRPSWKDLAASFFFFFLTGCGRSSVLCGTTCT
jgi:hypothetical protein